MPQGGHDNGHFGDTRRDGASRASRPHDGPRRRKYALRRRKFASGGGSAPSRSSGNDEAISRLEDEVAAARDQLREMQDRILRARADMDNQRRRFQREKDEIRKYAIEDLAQSLLNPMDHLSLAMKSLEGATDVESVLRGVEMIHREFDAILAAKGLVSINPADGQFDPSFHEAVGTGSDPDLPDGAILEVLRPGWALQGRVLRPAMVRVNRPAARATEEESLAGSGN